MESSLASIKHSPKVFDIRSMPYGVPFAKWTRLWWRWIFSIPKDKNPALDTTGHYCNAFQPYFNVRFLAGTLGGSVTRNCTIPHGKSLLFPVINYETSFEEEPFAKTEEQLEAICSSEIDDIIEISASIDGMTIEVKNFRVRSWCFEVTIPTNNFFGVREGITKIASDGYWLFIDSLSFGNHVLRSFGSCMSGRIKIGCTYNLTVI